MEELNKQKIKEEIKSLKYERLINLIKGITFFIGAIMLFIAIQRPESILNRKLSQETINRERAKLIFDLTQQNKSSKEILFGLSTIKKAYPKGNSHLIDNVIQLYESKIKRELNEIEINQLDSIHQKTIYDSRIRLNNHLIKREKYMYELLTEINDSLGEKNEFRIKIDKISEMKLLEEDYRVEMEIKRLENEIAKEELKIK